jgi:inhibitor of KinA
MSDASHLPRFLFAGETALVVEFGQTIDPAIHDRVIALDEAVGEAGIEGIIETVPTYRSLMVHYDPRGLPAEVLIEKLRSLDRVPVPQRVAKKRWSIPACYDLPHAEDLAECAEKLGLTPERVVALHLSAVFRVYMYGFAPGFTHMGGLPPELGISRRVTPRAPAPTGALIIAGGQAIITTYVMPTGWYMLGRTPVRMFDREREPNFLVGIGDEIVFERIDDAAFAALTRDVESGLTVAARAS